MTSPYTRQHLHNLKESRLHLKETEALFLENSFKVLLLDPTSSYQIKINKF